MSAAKDLHVVSGLKKFIQKLMPSSKNQSYFHSLTLPTQEGLKSCRRFYQIPPSIAIQGCS